ncbi:hypothetical protein DICSQDRAFT_131140 [Dichomitus squalens LYAD-421 SS1]|uniref:uncharacterized protein n=1 Tax=Dichomitus squalens (strain LYAD-421) TaxID=732165 RepID=UPI0004411433|nr:uncharacterized protein DICSQDRAFT_131140 [Dichomitus squalens LYAD-421 SS1]EJF66868.1 hypothetical protein DICSQDRAFT_131140 [Dichomitus squalens LYAD-421 SS1]
MASNRDSAELLTPPLSAVASDFGKAFPFGDAQGTDASRATLRYERRMGDTELSYFLPSRQAGVNDMSLHLGFRAKESVARRSRVRAVWAILRMRHPLLCARAEMHDYDDVRFVFDAPSSAQDALLSADANLEYRMQTKDELMESFMNGPRTLSNDRLSYLIISEPITSPELMPTPPRTPSPALSEPHEPELEAADDEGHQEAERTHQYELLICAMHFIGDGMALHTFANEFFGLLGGEKSEDELRDMLEDEWRSRWAVAPEECALPSALEDNMPLSPAKFRRVAAKVDFQLSEQRLVGGQVFPRSKHPERHTIIPTVTFPEDRTKAILKKCKAHGVSVSAALFAICNVAWVRTAAEGCNRELPTLMYSALNLRPYFTRKPTSELWNSYWYLAIGYFNVVLPSFLPSASAPEGQESTFWLRAQQAKAQSTKAAKNPLMASRAHEMSRKRGAQARAWGREDDEREKGTWVPPPPPVQAAPVKESAFPARAKAPSSALIGLSLLGNLDGIYKHATFPNTELHTLTTGSRQRHGGMLLFGYTFKGKLWISLGYDENGFADGVIDRFWKEAMDCVDQFLG